MLGEPVALEDVSGQNIVIGCIWQDVAGKRGIQSNWPFCKQIGKRRENAKIKDLKGLKS